MTYYEVKVLEDADLRPLYLSTNIRLSGSDPVTHEEIQAAERAKIEIEKAARRKYGDRTRIGTTGFDRDGVAHVVAMVYAGTDDDRDELRRAG